MMRRRSSWGFPLLKSLVLHGVVLGLLILRWEVSPRPAPPASPAPPEIVHAVAVDERQVEMELEQLRSQEEAERRAKQAERDKLKRQRQAEERRLRMLQRKQQEEQKRLRAMAEARRKQAEEEARRLAALKKRRREEKERLARLEQARQEAERKRKQEEERRRQEAEARRKAEEARRQAAESARREAEARKAVAQTIDRIARKVERYWLRPSSYREGLSCTIRVRVIPGGEVAEARVVRSSGDATFDRSAEVAVRKASPLPIPDDPVVFSTFREFNFKFKPEG